MRDAEGRQRVHGGVHDGRRNGDAPGLAQPLGTQRIAGRGRVHLLERDGRHVVGARDRVVHQGAGEELPVAIVDDRLEQGLAEPLRERAVELALGEERVDHRAGVIHPHEPLDDEHAGFAVDPHRRDDGAEAPHLALRLEVRARLEPGRLAGGQRVASCVAAPATSFHVTGRSRTPTTWKPPGTLTTSWAAASSSFAAIRRPFSRTSTATRARAPPPSATLRLPKVPKPSGPERVSPWTTTTSSGETPRWSATICAKVVSCPWPWALDPVIAVTRPERSTLMLPLSQPSAAGSMYEATPIPTISPWARRSACSRLSRV